MGKCITGLLQFGDFGIQRLNAFHRKLAGPSPVVCRIQRNKLRNLIQGKTRRLS